MCRLIASPVTALTPHDEQVEYSAGREDFFQELLRRRKEQLHMNQGDQKAAPRHSKKFLPLSSACIVIPQNHENVS
jgi:hypothetical protein